MAAGAFAGLSRGVEPGSLGVPCLDLTGARLRWPDGAIDLVDDGMRRRVPDEETGSNLFADPSAVVPAEENHRSIPTSFPISSGALLAKGAGDQIYLVELGRKWRTLGDAAMKRSALLGTESWSSPTFCSCRLPTVPHCASVL